MKYILIGLNHKTAPIEVRERFFFSPDSIPDTLKELKQQTEVGEVVLLSTCNRTEIYTVCDTLSETSEKISGFLQKNLPGCDLKNYIYLKENAEAAKHLFRVCCGIDSLLQGEKQILGQVKQSYQLSVQQKTAGAMLGHLFHQAISLGRNLHHQLQNSLDVDIYSDAVVKLMGNFFDPASCKVLVVGAGKIAGLITRRLQEFGNSDVFVSSRNIKRVDEFVQSYGGKPLEFDSLKNQLVSVDVVISSTAAPHFIIKKEWVYNAILERQGRLLLMLDLALPRDIEPEVKQIEGAQLYNIDELADAVELNIAKEVYLERAELMVQRATDSFTKWLTSRKAIPILKVLRSKVQKIGKSEKEKIFKKLAGSLDDSTKKEIELMLERTINKIIHLPTIRLKEIAADSEKLRTFEEIFGLDEVEEEV